MKIKEFSDRLGVPSSKIRYYDSVGLIQGNRSDSNNYRDFREEDALAVYAAQTLRSYDLTIQESIDAKNESREVIVSWIKNHKEELDEELRKIEMKLHRLNEMRNYFLVMKDYVSGTISYFDRQTSYNVFGFGVSHKMSKSLIEAEKQLANCMPFSYVAIGIGKESILEKREKLDVKVGLGILESNKEKLNLSISPEIKPIQGSKTACIYIECENPFELSLAQIQPLLDELEKTGHALTDDIVGRVYTSYDKNGVYVHGIVLGAIIQE